MLAEDEEGSVASQIVWCNVEDELLRQDFTRLNSSCSPQFVSPGMSALLAHGGQMPPAGEAQRPPSGKDREMDRRLSSCDTIKNEEHARTMSAESSDRGAPKKTGAMPYRVLIKWR